MIHYSHLWSDKLCHPAKPVIHLLGLFLMMAWSQAQERTCRFVYPERPQSAPKMAYIFDGKRSSHMNVPSQNFSDILKLPKGEVNLYISAVDITEPEKIPADTPKVVIPETVTDCYLVLLADAEHPERPFNIQLIDVSDQKVKTGDTIWYNFTSHRILAKLGSQELTMEPKAPASSPGPLPNSGHFHASFSYQREGAGPVLQITEQSWWYDAKSKHLGLVMESGGKLPKLIYFRDFRMPAH